MTKKNIFPVVATIAVVGVVLGVFSMTVMRDSNVSISTMTSEQAYANLSSKMKRIGVQEVSVNPQQLDVSEFLDAKDELPNIDSSYPFVVEGNGDVNIEIFSSGEKAAESGSDSFLTSMAKRFNAQHNKTSGDKTMSVSLRSVPSGTAAEYISTGKYQPECYTPSNTLFGELVKNEGVELTVEADRLAGNVAGILVSKKTGDMLRSEYGEASVSSVLNATIDGKLMMGYSNPYTTKRVNESMSELTTAFYGEYVRRMLVCIDEMTTEMRENANGKEYFPDIFHASSSVIADIFEACGIDLPDYVRILYYNDYMGDESIGRAAIEKIELAWQADPSKFRVDKKQNRLIYSYPPDGPWYELKYIADELPNSLEAEISGGNQLIMNYEQAQELFGIKFRRWLGIFNL